MGISGRFSGCRRMQTSVSQWAQDCFRAAEFEDARRTRRFVELMARLGAAPAGRITEAFSRGAERQAAYDFVEHSSIRVEHVIGAVGDACARACSSKRAALILLDGTSLSLTDRKLTKGFGSIGARKYGVRGLKVVNTLAVEEDGTPIGVPTQRYWVRAERAHRGKYRRVGERESVHWRSAVDDVAERFDRIAPRTALHFIADREGDASLLMRQILSLGHGFTMRAQGTRRIAVRGRRVAIRPALRRTRALARVWLHLPARANRQAREAELELRAARVPLILRDRHVQERKTHELTVVWVREVGRRPRGEPPVEWLLYTTEVGTSAHEAYAALQRYTYRWRIEEMHRTWKSGACRVEEMQLRSRDAATKWAAMLAAVAARVEKLKHLARTTPDEPASAELTESEIQALIILKRDQKKRTETVPDGMPSIAQAVRWIADIGGFTGGKGNGPPGTVVIARGFERVSWAAKALEAARQLR